MIVGISVFCFLFDIYGVDKPLREL